jgi:DNA-binding IclR family transcriptional regulator
VNPAPTKRATGTQAVDRAADLLVEVLNAENPVTFSHLTNSSGLAKGTASRLISALERKGLLQRNNNGEIETGSTLNRFALRSSSTGRLVAGQDAVENIAQVDAKFLLSSRNWVGQKVPFHASAAGKVLLAFNVAQIPNGKLEKLTNSTITNKNDLETELEKVRRSGYAVIIDELEPGLVAVSVPVVNESGLVVAALSVSGPAARLNQSRINELVKLLKNEVSKVALPNSIRTNRKKGAA